MVSFRRNNKQTGPFKTFKACKSFKPSELPVVVEIRTEQSALK
jgi:hypothetical protein